MEFYVVMSGIYQDGDLDETSIVERVYADRESAAEYVFNMTNELIGHEEVYWKRLKAHPSPTETGINASSHPVESVFLVQQYRNKVQTITDIFLSESEVKDYCKKIDPRIEDVFEECNVHWFKHRVFKQV